MLAAKVFKKMIKQPRPSKARKHDEGMPSRHAQSLYFFCAYLSIALLAANTDVPFTWRLFQTVVLNILTFGMVIVRWTEQLHSLPQLAVGALLGAALGSLWFLLSTTWINPFLSELLEFVLHA